MTQELLDWDAPEVRALLRPGGAYVDFGAHVGWSTAILAATGGLVHAYEPNPHAFKVLSGKFAAMPQVRCLNQAVAAEAGSLPLYLHLEHGLDPVQYASGSTLRGDKINVGREHVMVTVVRAADAVRRALAEAGGPLTLLKMDVEGLEFEILESLLAEGLLTGIGQVLVETHEEKIPSIREQSARVRALLRQSGVTNVRLDWK